MKRYWVFAWSNYYPLGGLNDLCLCTDDYYQAKSELVRKTKYWTSDVDFKNGENTHEYGGIMDMQELKWMDELPDSLEFGVFVKQENI